MENQDNQQTIHDGKNMAVIAYITLIGLIAAFVMNNDQKNTFASYHIRQCLGLVCTGFALSLVNIIPILGWIVSIIGMICLFVFWVMGLFNALNGREKPIPVLGNYYSKWFAGIQ